MVLLRISFSKNNLPLSALIRIITRSDVSHALMDLELFGQDIVFQAAGLSVNLENKKEFLKVSQVVDYVDIPLPQEDYARLVSRAFELCGRPYGWATLFGFGLVLLAKTVGIRVKNPWADGTHTFICAELMGTMLNLPDAEEYTPDELRAKLKEKYA